MISIEKIRAERCSDRILFKRPNGHYTDIFVGGYCQQNKEIYEQVIKKLTCSPLKNGDYSIFGNIQNKEMKKINDAKTAYRLDKRNYVYGAEGWLEANKNASDEEKLMHFALILSLQRVSSLPTHENVKVVYETMKRKFKTSSMNLDEFLITEYNSVILD